MKLFLSFSLAETTCHRAKAKRKMEAELAKVKGLGEAQPEVDDISAWVARSREAEDEAKRQDERKKAAKVASMYDEEVRQCQLMGIWQFASE